MIYETSLLFARMQALKTIGSFESQFPTRTTGGVNSSGTIKLRIKKRDADRLLHVSNMFHQLLLSHQPSQTPVSPHAITASINEAMRSKVSNQICAV